MLPKPVGMAYIGMTRPERTEQSRRSLAQMDRQHDRIREGFPEWDDVDEGLTDLDEPDRRYQQAAETCQDHIANAPEPLETMKKTDNRYLPVDAFRFELETRENVYVTASDGSIIIPALGY